MAGSLRLRAGVEVGEILPTLAPAPTPAKTVDSGQLQLHSRLRLRSPDSINQIVYYVNFTSPNNKPNVKCLLGFIWHHYSNMSVALVVLFSMV